jgi:hypothetical protein
VTQLDQLQHRGVEVVEAVDVDFVVDSGAAGSES